MIKGFKEFIAQGNALELAVAVIIGGAFKPIVDSITKVIMTIIGQLIGQPNFDSLGAFSLYQNGSYTFHLATAQELQDNAAGYVMPGTGDQLLPHRRRRLLRHCPADEQGQGAHGKAEGRGGGQGGHRRRAAHRDPRPARHQALSPPAI